MLDTLKFFLYLGLTGFGGPLMLIQEMRLRYVNEKKFLTAPEFDQAFTLIKAMPGPIAFQMAVFLGQKFHGFRGGLGAGFGLLLPAFIMMVGVGYYYDRINEIPNVNLFLDGFLFSVSAIILLSLKSLILPNLKNKSYWLLAMLSFIFSWKHFIPEPFIIIGFGILVAALKNKMPSVFMSTAFLVFDWNKIYEVFMIGLYGGAFVFGTGFALMPFLKTQMIDAHSWLSLKQFNDAVVFGQMTPGPITITGALLGYQVTGILGALAAMFGIFLIPFVHMTTWFPKAIKYLSTKKWINDFLLGATAAVVGSIVCTIVQMNRNSYEQPLFWILAGATFVVLVSKPKTPFLALILISGLVNTLLN